MMLTVVFTIKITSALEEGEGLTMTTQPFIAISIILLSSLLSKRIPLVKKLGLFLTFSRREYCIFINY